MLPTQINYPEFVPDQLLTSEHLNQMFGYLEEQERLTRTNLIGIGIVCGLEIVVSTDSSAITIKKGCGITSEGYLIIVPEVTYTHLKPFDAVKDRIYNKFVDGSRNQRFPIEELKQAAVEEGTSPIIGNLTDKVVLLFVELLEEGAKNCDPNSCDDKGINVTVTFRPLLVSKTVADSLKVAETSILTATAFSSLEDLKMPRFDVPNTKPLTTEDIFNAYADIIAPGFLTKIETTLTSLYSRFSIFVQDEFAASPFSNLATEFQFINTSAITTRQIIHVQYYYDLFSDIILAYDEFRETAKNILSACCADSTLFPRHLMLGETKTLQPFEISAYRNYFLSSPLFEQQHLTDKLKTLFRRLVYLRNSFFLPDTSGAAINTPDAKIRITPSMLWKVPLSQKAIPYYYRVKNPPILFYKLWNHQKTTEGNAEKNLSYHAPEYGLANDWVINPLKYDLEPYNFLRVEGHIGKPFTHVVNNLKRLVNTNRLPIEVVALRTGDVDPSLIISTEHGCNLGDLEISYDVARREWEANIGQTIEYLNLNLKNIEELFQTPSERKFVIDFIKQLQLSKTYMVDNLSDFANEYDVFISLFESIEETAEDIRALLAANDKWRSNLFVEDLIDHLDFVILSCKKGAFRAIYQEYNRRLAGIYAKMFFGPYTEKNPGIQHKAGVPIGGTFIVVYHQSKTDENNEEVTRVKPKRNLIQDFTGKVKDQAGKPIANAIVSVKGSSERTLTDNKGSFTIRTRFSPVVLSVKASDFINKQIVVNSQKDLSSGIALAARVAAEESAIENIPDGTVIADFYLPYLCSSDCQPIQFIIQEKPDPVEELTINIKEKDYCIIDKAKYAIEVSPEGGQVSGEGVETNAAGKTTFNPSLANLGTSKNKTIILTYTKDSQSVSINVVVHQKPTTAFSVDPGEANTFAFASQSTFADKFEWSFGDGEKSEEENPRHVYKSEGSFEVSLKVTNGVCTDTITQKVDNVAVKEKSCLPLPALIEEFFKLEGTDPQMFPIFTRIFGEYSNIESIFKKLRSVQNNPVEDQIKLFVEAKINTQLLKWLTELLQLVKASDVNLLALALYRILVNLAMYIQCIQKEDLGKSPINMEAVFKLLLAQFKELKVIIANFPQKYQDIFKQLLADIESEKQRIENNGETVTKPIYMAALGAL